MIILTQQRDNKKNKKLWLDPKAIISMEVVDDLTMIRCVNLTFFVTQTPEEIAEVIEDQLA